MKIACALTVCALLLAGGSALAADPKPIPLQRPGVEPKAIQPVTKPGIPGTAAKPDITSGVFPGKKKGIIIGGAVGGFGGKFVPWDRSVDLSDVSALPNTIGRDRCAFNVTYVEANVGTAPTAPPDTKIPKYTNRLKLDGAEVAVNSNRFLLAGQSETVKTLSYLSLGDHRLQLSLDDGNAIAEGPEGERNNVFTIDYTLKKCSPPCDGLPDLVLEVPKKMGDTWTVRNKGNCLAGSSRLTVDCKKDGHTGGGGGCPEIPPRCAGQNEDTALPDKFVVQVPSLAKGEPYPYTFLCWEEMQWPPGSYTFTFKADALNEVAEGPVGEGNNTATSGLTSP